MKVHKEIIKSFIKVSPSIQYSIVAICAMRIVKLALLSSTTIGTGISIALIGVSIGCELKSITLLAKYFLEVVDGNDKRLSHRKIVLIEKRE